MQADAIRAEVPLTEPNDTDRIRPVLVTTIASDHNGHNAAKAEIGNDAEAIVVPETIAEHANEPLRKGERNIDPMVAVADKSTGPQLPSLHESCESEVKAIKGGIPESLLCLTRQVNSSILCEASGQRSKKNERLIDGIASDKESSSTTRPTSCPLRYNAVRTYGGGAVEGEGDIVRLATRIMVEVVLAEAVNAVDSDDTVGDRLAVDDSVCISVDEVEGDEVHVWVILGGCDGEYACVVVRVEESVRDRVAD